jgi:hypothetical protein
MANVLGDIHRDGIQQNTVYICDHDFDRSLAFAPLLLDSDHCQLFCVSGRPWPWRVLAAQVSTCHHPCALAICRRRESNRTVIGTKELFAIVAATNALIKTGPIAHRGLVYVAFAVYDPKHAVWHIIQIL